MRTLVVGLSIMGAVALSMAPLAHAGSKGGGKVKVQDISVTKYQDVSSPRLMQKSKTGVGVFKRIKARPSFKAISDYPPSDYDDTGHDGLKSWPRIKELIAA